VLLFAIYYTADRLAQGGEAATKEGNSEFENPEDRPPDQKIEGRAIAPQCPMLVERARLSPRGKWSAIARGVRPSETDERRLTLKLLSDVQPAFAEQPALPQPRGGTPASRLCRRPMAHALLEFECKSRKEITRKVSEGVRRITPSRADLF
jgi:hypothetical protein